MKTMKLIGTKLMFIYHRANIWLYVKYKFLTLIFLIQKMSVLKKIEMHRIT